jgi:hypothetical protein
MAQPRRARGSAVCRCRVVRRCCCCRYCCRGRRVPTTAGGVPSTPSRPLMCGLALSLAPAAAARPCVHE